MTPGIASAHPIPRTTRVGTTNEAPGRGNTQPREPSTAATTTTTAVVMGHLGRRVRNPASLASSATATMPKEYTGWIAQLGGDPLPSLSTICLLYTSDAADEED